MSAFTVTATSFTAALALAVTPIGVEVPKENPTVLAWHSFDADIAALLATHGNSQSYAKSERDFGVRSTQESVQEIKAESGLSVEQIGRLLGVSRRSIHNWVNGSPIAQRHDDRISALWDMVFNLEAQTPEERRELLLDSNAGESLYRQFLAEGKEFARLHFSIPIGERFA